MRKALLVIIIAALTMGCTTFAKNVGTYAGMDLNLGYGHNFGNNDGIGGRLGGASGNIGANRFSTGKSYFNGGSQYPSDTISTSVTILLRPKTP
jgi:hypothetical protein